MVNPLSYTETKCVFRFSRANGEMLSSVRLNISVNLY